MQASAADIRLAERVGELIKKIMSIYRFFQDCAPLLTTKGGVEDDDEYEDEDSGLNLSAKDEVAQNLNHIYHLMSQSIAAGRYTGRQCGV